MEPAAQKTDLKQGDRPITQPQQNPSTDQVVPATGPVVFTTDQIVLKTQIRAAEERLLKRPSWSEKEIGVLLKGATDAVTRGDNLEKAKELLLEAQAAFSQDLQIANRNWYLLALIGGVFIVALITIGLCYLINMKMEVGKNLADIPTIVTLFTFAGMGSLTSVFTRLTNLDLKAELSRKFVIYQAIAKPLVAISFASIVYIILAHDLVTIGKWDTKAADAKIMKDPLLWVAAFLCGFSERFASDLVGRVIPSGVDSTGLKVP